MYQESFGTGLNAEGVEEEYFQGYGDVEVHRTMVTDAPRMAAYAKAIEAAVPGKVVMDVGAGTGVLSLMAARAGAAHVYAVEASPMASVIAAAASKNGYGDRITVLHKRVEAVDPVSDMRGKKPEVLVSEWMGFYLLHESMLESVLWARDHLLAGSNPDGTVVPSQMLPCTATIYAAPVNLQSHIDARVGVWRDVAGFDMSGELTRLAFEALVSEPLVECLEASTLAVAAPQPVASLNLASVREEDLSQVEASLRFRTSAPATAVALWFDTVFPCGCVLSTSPAAPPTHWKQTTVFLPIESPLPHDTDVPLDVTLQKDDSNTRCYSLSIQLGASSQLTAQEALLQALQQS